MQLYFSKVKIDVNISIHTQCDTTEITI